MFSQFFIERPVFATVLSFIIVIVGGVALLTLPVAQYPEVTPPTINVTTSYPGASAQTVADTVAAPIEQQINGVENMLSMESRCTNDGQMNLDVTFKLGTNLDMAQVLVQNRVSIANAKLPSEVRQKGVTTKKKSPSILLAINLISDKTKDPVTGQDRYQHSQLDLSNPETINVNDALARLDGVGAVNFLGARDYSMRIWLDPEKLASRSLMASDVTKAVSNQNVQVAAGRIGQPPTPGYIYFQTPIITQGRLATPEEFGAIILKTGGQGQQTYLRDVVRDRVAELLLDANRLKNAEKDLLAKLVFPLSILFVYLTVAALYEDWILPLSIILIVPMCMLSALGGVRMNGLDNDIFTQIGLVVLVGLASKNAILMVAFAKQRQQEGLNAFDAAVDASAARLRTILMTAFAFILGVVPLMLSSGAGSEMRRALGVAVFWGMLGVTVFGVFFTPVFYYVLRRLTGQGEAVPAAAPVPDETPKHLHG